MFKKNLFKKTLIPLTIFSACLLIAAGPLPPLPGTEEPDVKIENETNADEDETKPGINPASDDKGSQTKTE